jgi:hypothetical protein
VYLRGVTYARIKAAINKALRELRYRTMAPLTFVTDGDMESSGTTAWTASNATLSKVTTAAYLRTGAQALRVLATAGSGYAQSGTILVNPTFASAWHVRAVVQADVGTARLIAYDVTNSAEIESEDYTLRGHGLIDFSFELPATCEALAFRLMSVANSDDTYWDNLIAFPAGTREWPLPSYLTRPGQLLRVGWVTPDQGRADLGVFRSYGWHEVRRNDSNPNNPLTLHLSDPDLRYPSFIEVSRPYDELTTDSATTFCDRELLETAAKVNLLDYLQNRSPSQEVDAWRNEYRKQSRILKALLSTLSPQKGSLGFSEPF